jgi:hypothetical protein
MTRLKKERHVNIKRGLRNNLHLGWKKEEDSVGK